MTQGTDRGFKGKVSNPGAQDGTWGHVGAPGAIVFGHKFRDHHDEVELGRGRGGGARSALSPEF